MIYETWIRQMPKGFDVCYTLNDPYEVYTYYKTKDFVEAIEYTRLVEKVVKSFGEVRKVLWNEG